MEAEENMDVNEWREIWSYNSFDAVQLATVQALESNGIAVPRGEPPDVKSVKKGSVFGIPLDDTHQPLAEYDYGETTFQLPRVFVELVLFLESCTTHEGVFRKSGSVNRQRALRSSFDSGHLSVPPGANVHDVASLLKQYLRELPDPLLTQHFSPVYEACHALLPLEEQRKHCVLLTCLLLPWKHCQMLCVLMRLLHHISKSSDQSLMNATNLSVVMAPNLMKSSNSIVIPTCNPLQTQTDVVKLLIENWNLIGRVPPDVGVASETLSTNLQASSLDDIIKGAGSELPQRYKGRKVKNKQRTSSISGLVLGLGNRLKQKGVALTSGDYHMTSRGLRRKTTVKRKTRSQEDILLPNKRPAIEHPTEKTTPIPHPPIIKRSSIHLVRQRSSVQQCADGGTMRCEPVRAFKPSLTVKMDFVQQEKRVYGTGQTGFQGEPTNVSSTSGQTLKHRQPPVVCKTSPFSFATPHQLPHPTIAPLSATPPHFTDPESECIQVASFPLTPRQQINTLYNFSKPASYTSGQNHDDVINVSCDNKTTPTLPGNNLLDHAFLQTPFVTTATDHSPNLLDKISSEIARRHSKREVKRSGVVGNRFIVNESYKKAVKKRASSNDGSRVISRKSCSRQISDTELYSLSLKPSHTQHDGHVTQSSMTGVQQHIPQSLHSQTEQDGSLYRTRNGGRARSSRILPQDSILSDNVYECEVRGRLNLSEEGSDSSGCVNAESTDSVTDGTSVESSTVVKKNNTNREATLSSMTSSSGVHPSVTTSEERQKDGKLGGRRHYMYSATLGVTMESLTRSHTREMVEQQKARTNTLLQRRTNDKLSSNKTSSVLSPCMASNYCQSSRLVDSEVCNSPSALSASLGITHFKTPHQTVKKTNPSISRAVSHSNTPIPSPPPVLLHIVESNILTTATSDDVTKSASECSHQQEPSLEEHQDSHDAMKNASVEEATVERENVEHIYDVPQEIELAPEVMMDRLNSAKKKRSKDLLVTQAPSPRIPFGLRSPWLRPKKERQLATTDCIRTTEDGHVTKRASAYMVNGHAHQHKWGHAPLKRVTHRTTGVSNKENCCHGNTGVSKRNINTREWVV